MNNTININKSILSDHDQQAKLLEEEFKKNNIFVINWVSSPGAGKTELLSVLSKQLISLNYKIGVIVGDLATDNDAQRIKISGAQAYQINTNGNCHLEVNMIRKALNHLNWLSLDYLFIENVGNLVCPANFYLGENLRIVLMSVTEGEDKPLKYPSMFNSSNICIISKFDLKDAVNFNQEVALKNIISVNPDIRIFTLSSKTQVGLKEFIVELAKYRMISE